MRKTIRDTGTKLDKSPVVSSYPENSFLKCIIRFSNRYFVLYHLRGLKFLDSTAVTAEELKQAANKGHLMQIKRPKVCVSYLNG